MGERALRIPDPAEREDLAAFVTQAVRLDDAAIVRLRRRGDGRVNAWAGTGFEALAVRACQAELGVDDTTVAGDVLLAGLEAGGERIDLGFSLDSAWRGALPPTNGFVHVDDVPARVLVELAQRGVELAKEHSSKHGPPASLLDQEVIAVSAGRADPAGEPDRVAVPMRVVFALTAMGFIPFRGERSDPQLDLGDGNSVRRIDPAEVVRVRATQAWLRLDARYGSVAKRRAGELPLFVS